MRKLVLLVVILIMGIAVAGCQQAGITEEEVRTIVREEVSNQLATGQLEGIVGQEVTKQLANIDDLVGEEVNTQLSNIDELTLSKLYIKDNGELLAYLGADPVNNLPILGLYVGEEITTKLGSSVHGDGFLFLFGGDSDGQAYIGETSAGFGMYLWNRFGEEIYGLDTDSDGNGNFSVRNKYGEVVFIAP